MTYELFAGHKAQFAGRTDKIMHLSNATPAPGYPGMAGNLSSCTRGVDLFFCPGGQGIYPGLSGEFTLAKEPGFGAGNLAGI
jgi:hypothetical protein